MNRMGCRMPWLVAALLSIPVALPGCRDASGGDGPDDRPLVVATTGMIADTVRQVAGDRVRVVSLMGPGVDPHLHKPTRGDVQRLESAALVVFNGLHLEGRMGDTLTRLAARGRPVVAIADLIAEAGAFDPLREAEDFDPHLWMDVSLWSRAVPAIAERLIAIDPEDAAGYRARADAALHALAGLDTYVRTVIDSIPREQRVLITAHDAFGYFGRAYSIDVRGIQGISTESEAGVRDLRDLATFIVERRIGAIFVESSVPDRAVRALIEQAGARGHGVRIGGELFSDAMGHEGTYEGTYIGMMDHNATVIARALGGTAPATGMNGRLRDVDR